MRRLVMAAALLLCTSTAAAEERAPPQQDRRPQAWQAARWGMTAEQIIQAFPGAQPRQDAASDGYALRAFIPSYRIASFDYEVAFHFDGRGRLARIVIGPALVVQCTSQMFDSLAGPLTHKYGAPVSEIRKSLVDRELSWRTSQTLVTLKQYEWGIAFVHSTCWLSYTRLADEDMDKL